MLLLFFANRNDKTEKAINYAKDINKSEGRFLSVRMFIYICQELINIVNFYLY
jgi:hypothetical protein